ncbi:centrin 3 [Catenaria anguillulae PL171]|uniref:Centrin 3 n=1 Tax=Catenaria anguillulae PL171 TaxID=765915 RepID=A0A1Y2HL68_9FUNG|nr:centrin 3 [Catenaria anguillulae PL171]
MSLASSSKRPPLLPSSSAARGAGPAGSRRHLSAPPELSDDQKQEIREAFDLFDSDKDNLLDYHEVKVAMRALGFDLKKAEVLKMLKEYDHNKGAGPGGKQALEWDDFLRIATEKILARDPLEELRKAFALFDTEKRGRISMRDLRRVAKEVGEPLDDEELQAMVDEFDLDGDGEINEQEFLAIMTDDF